MNKWFLITSATIFTMNLSTAWAGKTCNCGTNCCWEIVNGELNVTRENTEIDADVGGSLLSDSPGTVLTSEQVESINTITIAEGFTSLGEYAFMDMPATSVSLPSTLQSIGESAFELTDIVSINIPNGVTSIGDNAFDNATSLSSVNIPEGVTSIGDYAFINTSSLENIIIPDSVTSIGKQAFNGSGISSIILPDSVTSIGQWAFDSCEQLKSISLPDKVNLSLDTFYNQWGNTTSLDEIIISDNVDTSLWDPSFYRYFPNVTIKCKGDVSICEKKLEKFRCSEPSPGCLSGAVIPVSDANQCTGKYVWDATTSTCNRMNEMQCNSVAKYYFNGEKCMNRPTDTNDINCSGGYAKIKDNCVDPLKTFAKKHYTPAEAAQWLHDGNDNFVILTFKK